MILLPATSTIFAFVTLASASFAVVTFESAILAAVTAPSAMLAVGIRPSRAFASVPVVMLLALRFVRPDPLPFVCKYWFAATPPS